VSERRLCGPPRILEKSRKSQVSAEHGPHDYGIYEVANHAAQLGAYPSRDWRSNQEVVLTRMAMQQGLQ